MVKRIISSLVIILSVFLVKGAGTDELWTRANDAYASGEYGTAVNLYDSIVREEYVSHKLYYNIGNAYFKNGQTGKAVLYYNKALLQSPGDKDTAHNLELANSYVKDRIEVLPEFFLRKWIRSIQFGLSSNMWAVVSVVMFAVMLISVILFLLSGRIALRKSGFYIGIISAVMFIFSTVFSTRIRNGIENPGYAVIISSSASVKSSPDNNSKDLFILHEGTKVRVADRLGEWREITIADGNKGWINRNSIELID